MVGKDKRCTLESQQKWSNVPFPATARAAVDEETIRPTKFCYLGNHSITLLSPGLNAWTSAATGIWQQINSVNVMYWLSIAAGSAQSFLHWTLLFKQERHLAHTDNTHTHPLNGPLSGTSQAGRMSFLPPNQQCQSIEGTQITRAIYPPNVPVQNDGRRT